jgi:cytoskeletal protein CcmA (bactofilin family)
MITVSTGTVMRGKLVASGAVRLDGRFEGHIVCARLEIGSDGYVNGRVSARELVVAGQIVGHVEATSVALEDGAFIEGDIRYAKLMLDHGATMTGKAIRLDPSFTPDDLALLEADLSAVDAQLDQMEDQARRTMVERAEAAYPVYEQARRKLAPAR